MSGFEITCVNKDQRGLILRVGGVGWSMEAHDAIVKLITNKVRLNILLGNEYVEVGVRGEGFDSYLAIEPEGQALHLVEGLPSC